MILGLPSVSCQRKNLLGFTAKIMFEKPQDVKEMKITELISNDLIMILFFLSLFLYKNQYPLNFTILRSGPTCSLKGTSLTPFPLWISSFVFSPFVLP